MTAVLKSPVQWIAAALLIGLAVGLLPLNTSLPALAIAILLVVSLIDLRVALVTTLTIAPLKALLDTEIPGVFDIGQTVLVVTLGMWIMRSIAAKRKLDLPWSPIYAPLILFILAASLSLFVSLSPTGTIIELLKWVEMIVLIALAMALSREYGVAWVAAALIVSAAVQAIIGIYEYNGGSGAAVLWILDFTHFRAFGSFGQPNPFGAFMGLVLPIALGATFGAASETCKSLKKRQGNFSPNQVLTPIFEGALKSNLMKALLFSIGSLIIATGLYVSWSRGAWIGFLAAFTVMVMFAPRRRIIGVGLIALVALGGGAFVFSGLAPASIVARISDFSQEFAGFTDVRGQVISDANYAVLERLAHWQVAINIATDSPWLGVGFGDYEVAYPRYQLMNWVFPLGHAHNYYLNLLAETGIVGLIAYLIAWIMIIGLTLRALAQTTGLLRGIVLGVLGAWTHLAVHSLFDKLFVNNLYLHLGIMLGLIGTLVIATNRKREMNYVTI